MKTKSILPLLAALAVSSCAQQEEVANEAVISDGSIQFDTYVGRNGSRSGVTSLANLDKFAVFAYNNGSTAYTSTLQPNFMYNQLVSKTGGAWAYNPIKYWPSSAAEKVSFFAYAPYTATPAPMTGGASGVISMSANNFAGDPTINFEVGKDVSKHVDLVYAGAKDKVNTGGTVNLDFKHALSRLAFKVVGWEPGTGETFDANTTVTINSVKICTKRKSATLNLNTGVWSNPADNANLIGYKLSTSNGLIQNNVITAGDTNSKLLNLANDYIMMFPDLSGAGSDKLYIFVDYTVKTVDGKLAAGHITKQNNVCVAIKPNFQPGKAYTITIHIGMNGYSGPNDVITETPPTEPDPEPGTPAATEPGNGDYIKFTATVSDWDETTNLVNASLVKN